jgi:hypothetical protein
LVNPRLVLALELQLLHLHVEARPCFPAQLFQPVCNHRSAWFLASIGKTVEIERCRPLFVALGALPLSPICWMVEPRHHGAASCATCIFSASKIANHQCTDAPKENSPKEKPANLQTGALRKDVGWWTNQPASILKF